MRKFGAFCFAAALSAASSPAAAAESQSAAAHPALSVCSVGTRRNDLVELLRDVGILGPPPPPLPPPPPPPPSSSLLRSDGGGGGAVEKVRQPRRRRRRYCDYDDLSSAAASAPAGRAVLAVSAPGGEESSPLDLSEHVVDVAALSKKGCRLYVEFAQFGRKDYRTSTHERIVVAPSSSIQSLNALDLLHPRVVNYTALEINTDANNDGTDDTQVDLYLATVAGYDSAVNLDDTVLHPLLVQYNHRSLMVAAMALSRLVQGRFAPHDRWRSVVKHIASFLGGTAAQLNRIDWNDTVRLTYSRTDILNKDAETEAFFRGVDWYFLGGQFPDVELSFRVGFMRSRSEGGDSSPFVLPPSYPRPYSIDGRMGLFEGYQKKFVADGDGHQLLSPQLRNDCISESAMALAFRHSTTLGPSAPSERVRHLLAPGTTTYGQVARNMLNFIWVNGGFVRQWLPGLNVGGSIPSNDPWGDAMGLMAWSSTDAASRMYYTDDNARALLAGMAARSRLGSIQWDSQLAGAILANLRMAGVHGFSQSSAPFSAIGAWEDQRSTDRSEDRNVYSPHYQSYIWAVFLRAYAISGHTPLLTAAKNAITKMMEHYPDYWQATSNGIAMQRARMLLPLAWLCRVEDTPQHRTWLDTIAQGLLARQDGSTGAIREEISARGWNSSARVPTNVDYGTFEAPLNQDNDDPVSDLLYTSNFALLGLHEASTLPDPHPSHVDAVNKLADLLVRAQVQSDSTHHPEFDGAWYRAFDYDKWEYWASDSDVGWGAWSIETGWTQAWIVTVLAMRAEGEKGRRTSSLWDVTGGSADAPGDALKEEILGRARIFEFVTEDRRNKAKTSPR